MGRYAGYLAIIIALIGGFKLVPPVIVLPLALFSTMFMIRGRQAVNRKKTNDEPPNPFVDGVFLFIVQLLIMFVVYLLGYFAGSDAGTYFMKFVTGDRG